MQLGGEGQEKKVGQGYNAAKGETRGVSRDGGVGRGGKGNSQGFAGACEGGEGDRGGGLEMG